MSAFQLAIFACLAMLVHGKVCGSLDVRNDPSFINNYRDCRVVQGNLQLVLIETTTDFKDFFNTSFTELYEITGYLMVFRVFNLLSLETIFPKLHTIGGNQLFSGYSLILYELPQLENIGLLSLRNITKGKVKIGDDPKLCYVYTVNWTSLGASRVIYNRHKLATCENEKCPDECGGFCWNEFRCQKTEPDDCHPQCIGCAQSNSSKHCVLCKYFNDSGNCVETCPDSKLVDNEASRCVSPKQCVSKSGNWSIFNKTCIEKCPDWHSRDSKGRCVLTEIKECSGFKINSHSDLEQVVGCTHINGALEIALDSNIEASVLEISMKSIVSISDFLKISRSPYLTSLSFFKRLKTIKGEKLWSGYALFVTQNNNLQKLFADNVTLTVENGEAIFQENPHLCPFEIVKINATSNYSNSNGGNSSCISTFLNVTIVSNNSTNVTLSWPVENVPNLTVISYTIYYAERSEDDYSLKFIDHLVVDDDGVPSNEGWNSVFAQNNTVLLSPLSPYTDYCYYIKTSYDSKLQLQTPVSCFKTATGDPSGPVDFEAQAYSDTIITLTWNASYFQNGKASHYKLAVYFQEDCLPVIRQRNYCIHPYKESSCTCPEDKGFQLISFDGVCIGKADYFCSKTVYNTVNDPGIKKRSVDVDCTYQLFEEYTINQTGPALNFMVGNLSQFTLYIFYLKACNEKKEGEDDHCSGPEMVSQKTKKRRGADDVTTVKVEVDGHNASVTWMKPREPNSVIVAYKIEYKKSESPSVSICKQGYEFESGDPEVEIPGLDAGDYLVRVRAVSLAGSGKASKWVRFEIAGEPSNHGWIYGLLIFFGGVIVLLLVLVIWRRYKLAKSAEVQNLLMKMSIEMKAFEEDDEWKLDDETIEIMRELGQNSIGILYRKQQ